MIVSSVLELVIRNVPCVGVKDMTNVLDAMEMVGFIAMSVMVMALYLRNAVIATARVR